MGKKMRRLNRQLALLLVSAVLIGMSVMENSTVSNAAISASEEKNARVSYGLNNPRTDSDGTTTWDCVWFGNYWQEDTNKDGIADKNDEKKPIKWSGWQRCVFVGG